MRRNRSGGRLLRVPPLTLPAVRQTGYGECCNARDRTSPESSPHPLSQSHGGLTPLRVGVAAICGVRPARRAARLVPIRSEATDTRTTAFTLFATFRVQKGALGCMRTINGAAIVTIGAGGLPGASFPIWGALFEFHAFVPLLGSAGAARAGGIAGRSGDRSGQSCTPCARRLRGYDYRSDWIQARVRGAGRTRVWRITEFG